MRWIYGALALALTLAAGIVATAKTRSVPPPPHIVVHDVDETAAWNETFTQVRYLAIQRDFAGLNAVEKTLRMKRARTPSGNWKLEAFFAGVDRDMRAEERTKGCNRGQHSFYSDWAKVDPKQPGPYIAEAYNLTAYAVCVRGFAPASQVPAEYMAIYVRAAQQAKALLEAHRAVAAVDPQYYAEMIDADMKLGVGPAEMQKLLKEAAAREPDYDPIYKSAIFYYLPEWYGQPGDVDRLGRFALAANAHAANAPADRGIYARLFWQYALLKEDCGCKALQAMDWEIGRQSMWDDLRSYPTDWNVGVFAKLACKVGDLDTAAQLMALLPNPQASWLHNAGFVACRQSVQARLG